MADASSFPVARNPDPDSSLPYLLRAPIDAEILEQVPIRSCRRRGAAIDLVLDRRRTNRSQIVFTKPNAGRPGGRPMIFWQTARTAGRARPGQRIPTRRASELDQLTIEVDTRERYPCKFAGRPVDRQRTTLAIGDYAIRDGERLVACVERRSPEDFTKSLIDGSSNYALTSPLPSQACPEPGLALMGGATRPHAPGNIW
jgi:hypothetical protein